MNILLNTILESIFSHIILAMSFLTDFKFTKYIFLIK